MNIPQDCFVFIFVLKSCGLDLGIKLFKQEFVFRLTMLIMFEKVIQFYQQSYVLY